MIVFTILNNAILEHTIKLWTDEYFLRFDNTIIENKNG
jgi:hypothetical protein